MSNTMSAGLISKITDYILLNAYSLGTSGFYYGKAGVSLALFEAARLLEDDYLEEHAFELLQESLLYKGADTGFANGYAGISFVLHYLVDHRFIEANVDELFGDREKKLSPATDYAIPASDLPAFPLSACIDRLYLLHREKEYNKEEIALLNSYLLSSSEEDLEKKLLQITHSRGISVAYADGLSRWLLYVVYLEALTDGKDVSRFDSLFKLIPLWKR